MSDRVPDSPGRIATSRRGLIVGGAATFGAAFAAAPLLSSTPAAAQSGGFVVPDVNVSGLTGATAGARYVGATRGGAPTSGTFLVGDTVIDKTGGLWVCTTAGTPGIWTFIGSGYELGYVQDTVWHAAITSNTDVALTGFTKTIVMPSTGRPIYIDVHIPMMAMTSRTPSYVVVSIYEDGSSLFAMGGAQAVSIPGRGYGFARFRARRSPSAGSHTYAVYCRVSAGSLTICNGWVPSDMTITQQ